MRAGSLRLDRISAGSLWLDGGAMFGVVPKALWARTTPCDELNRIELATNCLLIRGGRRTVLVDTGCGQKYTARQREIFGIDPNRSLVADLEKVGVRPEEVDVVVNTHLHFDHCGGNTVIGDQDPVPTFPRAAYLVQRQELEAAEQPNERSAASYNPDNWRPLKNRGQLELVDGETEVEPGITLVPTPGHTLGHQSVRINGDVGTYFYIADLCPTAAHVPLPWIMAYDLFPLHTLECRKRIYRRAVDEDWLLLFEHDPRVFCGYLQEEDGKYTLLAESRMDG